jgi:hypothetical protein
LSIVLFALAPMLLLAGSADQTSFDARSSILWENLRYGMPKSEVKALYPKYRATILDHCPVQVLSTYNKSKLKAVILINTKKSPPCADIIKLNLEGKYGPPSKVEVLEQATLPIVTPFMVTAESIHREDRIWDVGDLKIIFTTFPGAHEGYNVVYTLTSSSSAPAVH